MILLVNDANILIELLKIDLLTAFLRLSYEFHGIDFNRIKSWSMEFYGSLMNW